MTRPTLGSASTARGRLTLLFLAAIGLGAYLWLDPFSLPAEPSLHLSGDGSKQVLASLQEPDIVASGLSVEWVADDPADAALEVILLRRPENADGLKHLRRICPGVCKRSAVTTFTVMKPFDARRIVVVNLARLGQQVDVARDIGIRLDRAEPLTSQEAICIAQIVVRQVPVIAERLASSPPTAPPDNSCAAQADGVQRRVLPFDL
ncbi:hypothetical protein [Jannaschia donghaensis]|uniref:Uncharacterized protein n=1 Tax=Jannaschia donghaensis TaxID=420998 RepID=A0A0M6YCS9_9RHOB|nr:hypothetical protein [Jannaschia donghaensis]CTQ48162.1 hypothetical protein JDO7802_00164 [Jannaschia donghaensis]